ncbi:phosphatidate phosphatase [Synchytrium endobioticum]|uniref:phosphatidate phosphatase n=2 Tax=Synchytrium endobioticum TaxID=286115 RepID=A0A507D5L5_9FUNG|nr:phosphatidate phosphatase [Synchytrium endobioticum]
MSYFSSVVKVTQTVVTSVSEFYRDINPATLSGAIDVVVVRQKNGDLACSPFHVRFGKLKLLTPREKVVEVSVNGEPVNVAMKLGEAGEAFFVIETEKPPPSQYATSPIPQPRKLLDHHQEHGDVEPLDLGESIHEAATNDEHATQSIKNTPGKPGVDIVLDHIPESVPQALMSSALTASIRNSSNDLPMVTSPTIQTTSDVIGTDEDTMPWVPLHTRAYSGPILDAAVKNVPVEDGACEVLEIGSLPKPSMLKNGPAPSGPLSDGGFEYQQPTGSSRAGWSWHWGDLPTKTNGTASANRRFEDLSPSMSLSEKMNTYLADLPHADKVVRPVSPDYSATDQVMVPERFNRYHVADGGDSLSALTPLSTSLPPRPSSSLLGLRKSSSLPPPDTDIQSLVAEPPGISAQPLASDPMLPPSPYLTSSPLTLATNDNGTSSRTSYSKLEISTCGWTNIRAAAPKAAEELFSSHKVDFSTFCASPALLSDPNTVFRINGRYYNWIVAGPLAVGQLAFGESLSDDIVDQLVSQQAGKEVIPAGVASIINKNTQQEDNRRYSISQGFRQWWTRGATPTSGTATTTSTTNDSPSQRNDPPVESPLATQSSSALPSQPLQPQKEAFLELHSTSTILDGQQASLDFVSDANLYANELINGNTKNNNMQIKNQSALKKDLGMGVPETNYAKTLRLTSDQLKALDLKPGANSVTFTVTQGKAQTSAQIFLWNHDDKVVISDIDGTITKSDALGHLFTMVGRDWTHAGVASLYTNIRSNGYQILYLTSRAIGQASYTRDYLRTVNQGSYQLPAGPVIMSPDRLFTAFHREVIMRKPEEFKIACLRDIKRLFGNEIVSPFYAGFGNRITDALSYRSVDVPPSRIFSIDPTGEIRLELMVNYKSSYIKLNDLVDQIFPPLTRSVDTDFSDFGYWRTVLPDMDVDLESGFKSSPLLIQPEDEYFGGVEDEEEDEEYEDEEEEASGEEKGKDLTKSTRGHVALSQMDGECGICYQALSARGQAIPSPLTSLPCCGQILHNECIRQVLAANYKSCPYCRSAFGKQVIALLAGVQHASTKAWHLSAATSGADTTMLQQDDRSSFRGGLMALGVTAAIGAAAAGSIYMISSRLNSSNSGRDLQIPPRAATPPPRSERASSNNTHGGYPADAAVRAVSMRF